MSRTCIRSHTAQRKFSLDLPRKFSLVGSGTWVEDLVGLTSTQTSTLPYTVDVNPDVNPYKSHNWRYLRYARIRQPMIARICVRAAARYF